jgi:transcriptional regulator with XRE-family HTH domain
MARKARQEDLSDYQIEIDEDDLRDRVYEAIESLVGDDTVREICRKTGLSNGVVTRLVKREHRTRWPSVMALEKLAQAYSLELVISFE